MPTRHATARTRDSIRPLTPAELERRLDDVLDAVGRLARGTGERGLGWLPPADLLRCLGPLVSRN